MDVRDADIIKRREGAAIRQRRARVCYSYEPQHEDELALKVGDEVTVAGEDEEGWYQATVNGRSGVCPSNFLELLPDEVPELPTAMAAKSPSSADASTTKELKEKLSNSLNRSRDSVISDSGVSKRQSVLDPLASGTASSENRPPEDAKQEIQSKKIQGVGFGDIFKGGPVKLRPAQESNGKEKPEKLIGPSDKKSVAATEAKKDKEPLNDSHSEYAKADYDYQAQNGDELSFKTGDIIKILTKECEDEGWWRGELNGLSGVFPDNFCSVIPLSEVPAPKRPVRIPASEKLAAKKDDPDKKDAEKKDKLVDKTPAKLPDKPASSEKPAAPDKSTKPDKPEKPSAKPALVKKPASSTTLPRSREESPIVDNKDAKLPTKAHMSDAKRHDTDTAKTDALPDGDLKHSTTDEPRTRGSSSSDAAAATSTSASTPRRPSLDRDSKSLVTPPAKAAPDPPKTESLGGTGFDALDSVEKLRHPTAARARGPARRPPSMIRPNSNEEDGKVNGVDASDDMTKDREPKSENRKSALDNPERSSLSKKDSFLKQLDAALGGGGSPRSPVPKLPADAELSDDVTQLRDALKTLKEDFSAQLKEMKELIRAQGEKITTLEKEIADLKKAK